LVTGSGFTGKICQGNRILFSYPKRKLYLSMDASGTSILIKNVLIQDCLNLTKTIGLPSFRGIKIEISKQRKI